MTRNEEQLIEDEAREFWWEQGEGVMREMVENDV